MELKDYAIALLIGLGGLEFVIMVGKMVGKTLNLISRILMGSEL